MEKKPQRDIDETFYGEWARCVSARCPACFSRRSEIVRGFHEPLSKSPWRIVRCLDCSQMYTDPQPPADAWEVYYPEDYPPHQVKEANRKPEGWRRQFSRLLLAPWKQGSESLLSPRKRLAATLLAPVLRRKIDPYLIPPPTTPDGNPPRLLDVGCGSGKYLARMKELGWDVQGIDFSARAAATARQAYGVEVLVGTVPNKELPAGSFDMVTAWQVVEHLQRPRQALAGIRSLLKPEGCFIMSVPNQASWAARFFGPDWIGLDLPRHLTHFTPETLQTMLRTEGFYVAELSTICHSGWIRQSARDALRSRPSRKLRTLTSHSISSAVSRWAQRKGAAESIYAIARVSKPRPVGTKLDREL